MGSQIGRNRGRRWWLNQGKGYYSLRNLDGLEKGKIGRKLEVQVWVAKKAMVVGDDGGYGVNVDILDLAIF